MRPLQLVFFGMGSYAGEERLDFENELGEQGIFLIHGATGAGKTTILDAITYALYGQPSGRSRMGGKSFRADMAPADKPSWAELVFAVGASRYRIYRSMELAVEGRKTPLPPKAELYALDADAGADGGAGERLLSSRIKDVTVRVTELLGIDQAQFCQVVLLPQGDFQTFLMADSKARSEILQKLFRTERYSQIEQRLKDKASALEKEAKEILGRRDVLLEQAGVATKEDLETVLREGRGTAQTLAAEEKTAKAASDAAQKAKQDGEALAARFAEYDAKQKELADSEAKRPAFEAYQKKYEEAKRAVTPMERESRAKALEKEAEKRKTEAESAAKTAEAAKLRAEALGKSLGEEEAREPERAAGRKEKARLESLREAVASYGAAEKAATEAEDAARQAGVAAERAEKARAAGDVRLKTLAQKEKALLARAGEGAKAEVELAELRQNEELAKKLDGLSHDAEKAAKETAAASAKAAEAEAAAESATKGAERLRALYRLGAAYALTEGLEDGKPCPVCGAEHHPHLAVKEDIAPTKAELDEAEDAAKKARAVADKARAAKLAAEGREETVARLTKDAGSRWNDGWKRGDALREALAAAEARKEQAAKDAESLIALQARVKTAEAEQETLAQAVQKAAETAREAGNAASAARGRQQEGAANLPAEFRHPGVLEQRIAEVAGKLSQQEEALKRARQAAEEAHETATEKGTAHMKAAEEAEKARAAAEKGKEDFEDALRLSKLPQAVYYGIAHDPKWSRQDYRDKVEKRIRDFTSERAAIQRAATDSKAAVEGKERPDVARLRAEAAKAAEAHLQKVGEHQRLEERLRQQEAIRKRIEAGEKEHDALDKEYRLAKSLASVASGEAGVHFSTYVQRSIFADVMDAANKRLSIMSRDKFQLVMGELGQDYTRGAKGWEGLELAVLDADTGRARGVRSLSGGESFLASLSLALGLSDIVQEYAGGVHLDTMFIDEGFGTLDEEALDKALDALVQLHQEGARLVGIISHVRELETRIPARLEVERDEKGSHAHFELGAKEE